MAKARIYQPAKTAMQAGRGNTHKWVLEFEPTERKVTDALMGWVGSGDMDTQVRLKFPTRAEAESYCKREGIAFTVTVANPRRIKPKAYADNFAFKKVG